MSQEWYLPMRFDMSECSTCDDTGFELLTCCSGYMCGCYGYPVKITRCKCGCELVSMNELESRHGELLMRNVECDDELGRELKYETTSN